LVNEIIAIGRINIDMIMYVDTLPGSIRHVVSDKGHISFGGSAANFAVESSLLGVKTGLVSCVGNDIYGEMVLKQLSKLGVDTNNVLVLGKQATGLFFMARHPTDGNIVVANPGANRFLEKHVLDEDYIARASSVHVAGGFPMMTSRALEIASNNGMIFSLDPGHAADNVDFSKILPGTDLLFVNQYELKRYFKINLSEKALKTFAKGFPGMVIVKVRHIRGACSRYRWRGRCFCRWIPNGMDSVREYRAGTSFRQCGGRTPNNEKRSSNWTHIGSNCKPSG
jgi:ribokinase